MKKNFLNNDYIFLIKKNYEESINLVSEFFDLTVQELTSVNNALAAEKPVLMILPVKNKPGLDTSVFKPQLQNDFATLMRKVEKEVYR